MLIDLFFLPVHVPVGAPDVAKQILAVCKVVACAQKEQLWLPGHLILILRRQTKTYAANTDRTTKRLTEFIRLYSCWLHLE